MHCKLLTLHNKTSIIIIIMCNINT